MLPGLGYRMEMPDLHISIIVDHLRRSSGDLHAQLTVKSDIPGARTYNNGVVLTTRFNLSAATTRKQIGTLLKERVQLPAESQLDWYGFLEDFCQRVLAVEQDGSPIIEIGNLPTPIIQRPLISPILNEGKPTILFGDGGVGKSLSAVALAVSVRLGRPVIPGFEPHAKGDVLYLDWESDEYDLDSRVRAVSAGVDVDPVNILYRYCARPLADGAEDLARIVRDRGIKLVVVDSAGAAMGTSHEGTDASDGAVRFFAAIRLLGCAALVVDHVAKAAAGQFSGAGKPYGSTYKTNLARSTWEMRQAHGTSNGAIHVAMYHRKSNMSALHAGMGMSIHFDGGRVWFESEPITNEELIGSLPLAERIEVMLKEQSEMELADLVEAVGSTKGAVASALHRHPEQFIALSKGRWALIDGGRTRSEPTTYRDQYQD